MLALALMRALFVGAHMPEMGLSATTGRRSLLWALVPAYLAAIVGANLLVNHLGATYSPVIAFFLVAAVLIFRDQFADLVGPRRWITQAALMLVGAALTWVANPGARQVALASVVAFGASEATEAVAYYTMRARPWMDRAPLSATLGAAIDSVLFITIAFGFNWQIAFAQFAAKTAGGYLWAKSIEGVRSRAVPARDTPAELAREA